MCDSAGIDAEQSDRRLLVGIQEARSIPEIVEGRIAGYQSAVITPIEGDPGQFQPRLILKMSRLVERLVVVDAENFGARDAGPKAGNLGREVARPDVRKHGKRRKPVVIR